MTKVITGTQQPKAKPFFKDTSSKGEQSWIGNPVFNCKVEQALRAILLPLDDSFSNTLEKIATNTFQVSAVNDTIINNIQPEWYKVGESTTTGWSFTSLQNSLLTAIGMKPSVVLFTLCRQCLRDLEKPESEVNAPAIVDKGNSLLMFAPALITAAYSLVLHYDKCAAELDTFVEKYNGYPEHFKQRYTPVAKHTRKPKSEKVA